MHNFVKIVRDSGLEERSSPKQIEELRKKSKGAKENIFDGPRAYGYH